MNFTPLKIDFNRTKARTHTQIDRSINQSNTMKTSSIREEIDCKGKMGEMIEIRAT